ncbi:CheR family methyltransferase [Campylobacter sp. US33a]|uniref:protein-glutamate O-methyltransferase n=1 Tax=Campylobacter sp. CCS1377 TaxID=3158229 RepID=A0AAU7E9J8_9BACT|nr:CheR family methyltransferase [Campylobacter sp. US33a]MCW1360591.1 methyltransferase domain-containing protein [Campylobacter jejuni]TEY00928.1 methyltransferase domain-containing protein [Campylobacter sp. US33a]
MNNFHINEQELYEFIKIINEISGIDLSDKKDILPLKLSTFFKRFNITDFKEFVAKLKFNTELRQNTLDFITINETYFHRELTQLKEIIFYAKSLDRTVNILSAPCSSGEEVYSLAILGAQNFVKNLQITGIDINNEMINKAKIGKYTGRTLQRLSEIEKKKFFTQNDEFYTINKKEICNCRFELYNVFDPKFPQFSKFDIIVSRNMMIYFDYDSKIKLLENFYKLLSTTGRLYIGNADLVPENIYFKKVFSSKGVYYEKL